MDPVLLAAAISQIGIPELKRWFARLRGEGKQITDAEIIALLGVNADKGIEIGEAWLAANPE